MLRLIKKALHLIALLIIWGCSVSNSNKAKEKETTPKDLFNKSDSTEIQSSEPKNDISIDWKIDIDLIKECAENGISSFNMDSIIQNENYLENEIVKNVLGKIPINGVEDWHLSVNEYEPISCYQWEENQQYFLFSLLQSDESCCLNMYLCLSDKAGNLLEIRSLALSGGDGGWYENDWGEKLGFGKFKLFFDSYYSEDIFDNDKHLGNSRENEYTELLLSLEDGKFIIDTLIYTNTDTLITE